MRLWARLSRRVCDPLRLSPLNFNNGKVHTPLEELMKRQSLLGAVISLTLGVLFMFSITCLSAFGQAGTSTIRGIVKDPQGNVVSGATVTLTNVGTTTSRTASTSDLGAYAFEFVPVGDYKVEVEAKGFKKAVVTGVHALVAKPTSVDMQLEIGNLSETVTVASGSTELL